DASAQLNSFPNSLCVLMKYVSLTMIMINKGGTLPFIYKLDQQFLRRWGREYSLGVLRIFRLNQAVVIKWFSHHNIRRRHSENSSGDAKRFGCHCGRYGYDANGLDRNSSSLIRGIALLFKD